MSSQKRRRRRSNKTSSFNIKRAPVLLLLPALMVLIFTSFQQMRASIINSQAQSYLEHWGQSFKEEPQAFSIDEKELQIVEEGVQRVLAIEPDAPEYNLALAKLEDWRVINAQLQQQPIDVVAQEQGLAAYRTAIQQRPAWPYAWSDFAMAKARARQIDQAFFNALERAISLGPWERGVMTTVAQLQGWYAPWLPEQTLQIAQANLQRLALRYPGDAMKIAREQGRTSEICLLLKQPERYKRDCAKSL
ncbi:hypothetical protein [Parendozoicomonas sp. Alg238-R29]|uniref:hypothetical protein n=1 Tax=Parendozoicomonas sp. Alg238-R29 TaxID=2993446 RepID=UPI00248E39F5|nr:hypothetical protein [Parendozoicomonas sp. Alg238-R29]